MTTQRTFEPHEFEPHSNAENICRHCDRGRYALHHLRYEQSSTTEISEQCADDCRFGDHDEPPALQAGERERVPSDVLAEMRGLVKNWNSKSRLEQIIARHRIHGLSGIPDSEYSCSWQDVRLLIIEHNQHATLVEQRERLVKALKMMAHNAADGSGLCWCEADDRVFGHQRKCTSIRRVLNEVKSATATIEQEGEASR